MKTKSCHEHSIKDIGEDWFITKPFTVLVLRASASPNKVEMVQPAASSKSFRNIYSLWTLVTKFLLFSPSSAHAVCSPGRGGLPEMYDSNGTECPVTALHCQGLQAGVSIASPHRGYTPCFGH